MLIAHDSKKAEGVTAFGDTNLVMGMACRVYQVI
jgi:hypothetical protein